MMVLRIKRGGKKGKAHRLDKGSMVVGRDTSADIVLEDDAASRRHAEIFKVGEMYFVKDLGSRNGTFLNEEAAGEELLRVGDRIRIGNTILVFGDDPKQVPEEQVHFSGEAHINTTGVVKLDDLDLETKCPAAGFELLYDVAKAISSEHQLEPLLDKVASEVHKAISADETYVFVKSGSELKPMAVKKTKGGEAVSRSIITNVMQTKRSVLTMDAVVDSRFKAAESIVAKEIHSVITAPLISMDKPKGVIYAAKQSMTEQFTDDDLELVSAVAMMAGVAIEGIEVRENQKAVLLETVKTLVAAVELRDPSSKGHSERVANICGAIATEMKLSAERNERVRLAGLLHDIGKVAISEDGLHSVGQRTDGVKGGKAAHHVLLGEEIISNMPELSDISEAVKTHHEAFDGSGFPEGLKEDKIPVIGRVIAVADGFDHLLARGGIKGENVPVKGALMQVGKMSGKRYDPDMVKALLIAHRNGNLFSSEKKMTDEH